MKFVLTGDLHFKISTFSPLLGEYEGIYYPRENLYKAAELCRTRKCDGVIILGDVLDRPMNSHFLLDTVYQIFEELGVPLFVLLGNHDLSIHDDTMYTSLNMLRSLKETVLIDDIRTDLIPDTVFVPYHKRHTLVGEEAENYLGYNVVTHIGITGFEVRSGLSIVDEFHPEYLKLFKFILTGHYHKPQREGNILYVGSPWAIRMDEREAKNMYVWDTDTNEIETIEETITPTVKDVIVTKKEDLKNIQITDKHTKLRVIVTDNKLLAYAEKLRDQYRGHIHVQLRLERTQIDRPETVIDTQKLTFEHLISDYLTEEEWDILRKYNITIF